MGYVPGDFWRICDRTGFKVRASHTQKEWTGAIVRNGSWEQRHPQDFVRGRADDQRVIDPRPRPTDVFSGNVMPYLAAAASPGDTTITVDDASRMSSGDTIRVILDNGDHLTTINGAPSGNVVTLAVPMPGAAAVGNAVVDLTATL